MDEIAGTVDGNILVCVRQDPFRDDTDRAHTAITSQIVH